MKIETVVVGYLSTNCYLLKKDKQVLIIDPGAEGMRIIENVGVENEVVGIFVTHSHDDHIGALDEIAAYYNAPVYDRTNLKEGTFSLGAFHFKVLYTPGHKSDGITLYFEEEKKMFVGDFIFKGSIGRIDMPESNPKDMHKSIVRILTLPKDILIYPGHYDVTSLHDEEENLRYFLNII